MNRDSCQAIEERLVDFTDGTLAGDEEERVQAHIEHCPHCRATVEALRQSLRCAEVIWRDNLCDTQAVRVRPHRLWRRLAVAASTLLACGLAMFWSSRPRPLLEAPTLAEIEQRIAAAGTAARLLAATDQLEAQASLRGMAENQYRYILAKYPDTEAAVEARLRLKSFR